MAGKRAILHRMIGVFLSGYPLYYTYRQPLCSDFLSPKRQRPDKHTEPREAADMSLGNSLFNARRKSGLSQEEVAEKLGVSRQTISKWELDETLPDIRQSKKLSVLYHVTLDELVDFDIKVKEIEEVIERTSEETQQKIDWTQMWAKKYPVLASYKQEVKTEVYTTKLQEMLTDLKRTYGYGDEDAFLVLKDILAQIYNAKKA